MSLYSGELGQEPTDWCWRDDRRPVGWVWMSFGGVLSRSFDGGVTWHVFREMPYEGETFSDGDPSLDWLEYGDPLLEATPIIIDENGVRLHDTLQART